MEQPRAHDPKKNSKTIPVVALNIGAGAGSFGVGGIVLLGGALVATTIVSVLAFKRRKLHQLSTEKIPPSDDVTIMKEMETKIIQNLTKDEKRNSGSDKEEVDSGDSKEEGIYSVVVESQEDKFVYVDSVFENRELDDSDEVLECEEQVVMKARIEEDNSFVVRDDGGEEQKYWIMIEDEKDKIVDATLLVTDETITSIEEYEAIEAPLRDDVVKESEEDYEIVFMNEEAATESACLNQVKVNDNSKQQFVEEEKEKDGYDETISENYAEQVVATDATRAQQTEEQNHPQLQLFNCQNEIILDKYEGEPSMQCSRKQIIEEEEEEEEEEATNAACVDLVDTEDILKMADNEFVQVNNDCETFDIPCINEAINDQITLKEDNSSSQVKSREKKGKETTSHKVKEQVSIEDDMSLPLAQPIEETQVDDQTAKIEDKVSIQLVNEEKEDVTDVQVEAEMNTEDELVKKERIIKEDEVPSVEFIDQDVKVRSNKSSDELEDNIRRILGRGWINSDKNGIIKDDKGSKSASKKQVLVSEPWNIKLMMIWSLLVSIWCLCHWYSQLPYPQLSLVGSLFFVLILLLGYRNRTTYLV